MNRNTKGDDELCMAEPFQAVLAVHGVLRRHEPPEFMIRTIFYGSSASFLLPEAIADR